MFLQCLKWIPHICHQLVGLVAIREKGFVKPLPDDIIIDILSRLPAECVLECRKVCRLWLALTSTPHFIEMHLKRATPEIFVQCLYYQNLVKDKLDLFIFYEGAKKGQMIKKMLAGSMYILKGYRPLLIGSCNGLLLFKSSFQNSIYGICNPVTRQRIHLLTPGRSSGFLCGFFFHSPTKEFRVLYVARESAGFEYFIYTLGDKSWRRLATVFPYEPARFASPVMVNGVLYWMVDYRCAYNRGVIYPCSNSVMMFNVDTEDFSSMPHPEMKCGVRRRRHEKMQLMEMEGQLSCYCVDGKLMLGIWVLENYENWFWVGKYKVNLNWDVRRYPTVGSERDPKISIVYIRNDELLLDWCGRGLFRYHMGRNSIKKIDKSGMKMPNWETHRYCITMTIIKSLTVII